MPPMKTVTCLDDPASGMHARQATGLDIVDGVLCNTRRCVWCQLEEHKPYGAGGRRPWKTTKTGA